MATTTAEQSATAVVASAATATAITTIGLRKVYGSVVALAGLNMSVPRGEVFGFLGPNGAGKTTAVKLLVGLASPTSGEAWVLGAPVGDLEVRKRLGYLPELFRYQDWLSAREVLALHCELAALPRRRWSDQIDAALVTVGLTTRADDRVVGFSKGMQQRLGLGAALLGEPELVLLDEPTSALDPVGRHDVREIIRTLKQRGCTVFLNSHLLSEVELVCDRAAIVNHGRVIALGTMHELLSEGRTARVRATGLDAAAMDSLRRFGEVTDEQGWLTVRGIDEAGMPDLVAEVVRRGGRVYAVEHGHQTLEDRFLQLLERPTNADLDDRPTHAG